MSSSSFVTTRLSSALGWARKYSLFHYPFITACCGMEYMSTACAHFDLDRFGAGWTRFSPRQADLLFVVGTISQRVRHTRSNYHLSSGFDHHLVVDN